VRQEKLLRGSGPASGAQADSSGGDKVEEDDGQVEGGEAEHSGLMGKPEMGDAAADGGGGGVA